MNSVIEFAVELLCLSPNSPNSSNSPNSPALQFTQFTTFTQFTRHHPIHPTTNQNSIRYNYSIVRWYFGKNSLIGSLIDIDQLIRLCISNITFSRVAT